jgi:hypothetical protein
MHGLMRRTLVVAGAVVVLLDPATGVASAAAGATRTRLAAGTVRDVGANWQLIERLSWIAVIVAAVTVPLVLLVSLFQLRDLLRDLVSRPNIQIGFMDDIYSPMIETITRTPIPIPAQLNKAELELTIWSINEGSKSATNLVFNYIFPDNVSSPDINKTFEYISGRATVKELPSALYMIARIDYLHPNVIHRDTLSLCFPDTLKSFEVEVHIFMSDSPDVRKYLRVNLRAEDEIGEGDVHKPSDAAIREAIPIEDLSTATPLRRYLDQSEQ